MIKESDRYWLWLCSQKNLYYGQRTALLKYFGSPEEIFFAPGKELEQFTQLGLAWAGRFSERGSEKALDLRIADLKKKRISFLSSEAPGFPSRLKQISDCPHGLFFRGTLPGDAGLHAAIVGARSCTPYGSTMTRRLAKMLSTMQVPIVSGMARGIDGIAQQEALLNGGTSFAVLGSGADVCYPPEHEKLYHNLAGSGGVISEYPCGAQPLRAHFPARNRLISALSDIVIVVEARIGSGSLITADFALDQGKEVFAVPGRTSDLCSRGCLRLISEGAGVILTPEDFMQFLAETGRLSLPDTAPEKKPPQNASSASQLTLAADAELVYSYLDSSPKSPLALSELTGLASERVAGILVSLLLAERADEIAKNQYIRRITI